jgi:hypothetical protein
MRTRRRFTADSVAKVAREAVVYYGRPVIFDTGQDSQLTSFAFTNTLKECGVADAVVAGWTMSYRTAMAVAINRARFPECLRSRKAQYALSIGYWISCAGRPDSTFAGRTPTKSML